MMYLRYNMKKFFLSLFILSSFLVEAQIDISILPIYDRYCEDTEVEVKCYSTQGIPTAYTWTSDVGIILSSDSSKVSIEVSQSGYIYVTASDGVFSDKDSVYIIVDAKPKIEIQGPDSICYANAGQTVIETYRAITTNTHNVFWVGTNIHGNIDRLSLESGSGEECQITFEPLGRDTFLIGVIASGLGSCQDISLAFDVRFYQDSTCILRTENYKQETISIYPNPSSGIVTIENRDRYEVNVYDKLGRKVAFDLGSDNAIRIYRRGVYSVVLIEKKSNVSIHKKLVVR